MQEDLPHEKTCRNIGINPWAGSLSQPLSCGRKKGGTICQMTRPRPKLCRIRQRPELRSAVQGGSDGLWSPDDLPGSACTVPRPAGDVRGPQPLYVQAAANYAGNRSSPGRARRKPR